MMEPEADQVKTSICPGVSIRTYLQEKGLVLFCKEHNQHQWHTFNQSCSGLNTCNTFHLWVTPFPWIRIPTHQPHPRTPLFPLDLLGWALSIFNKLHHLSKTSRAVCIWQFMYKTKGGNPICSNKSNQHPLPYLRSVKKSCTWSNLVAKRLREVTMPPFGPSPYLQHIQKSPVQIFMAFTEEEGWKAPKESANLIPHPLAK